MRKKCFVVDNRVFLLGLDDLYREAMKNHERTELLQCARETAQVLAASPADVPIEGYYSEDADLTEYFRLMRALQQVPASREREVLDRDSFRRLKQVMQSGLYGPPHDGGSLLPAGEDPLSVALKDTFPKWSVDNLTAAAYDCAASSDDFSLVALAALSKDSVVLAALRETCVLYALAVGGSAYWETVWEVDEVIQQRAQRFVQTFNDLFDEALPIPGPENAREYWNACKEWKILGRCVRIGFDDSIQPTRHYHWAIDHGTDHKLVVKGFWDTDIWTTERYSEKTQSRM